MNGPVEDRATAQRAEIHVGLSDRVLTELAVRSGHIPVQRAGSAYEQQVLAAGRNDLADLSDSAEIPQLGKFVRDYIRDNPETETRP